jgi:hypothetical protein
MTGDNGLPAVVNRVARIWVFLLLVVYHLTGQGVYGASKGGKAAAAEVSSIMYACM